MLRPLVEPLGPGFVAHDAAIALRPPPERRKPAHDEQELAGLFFRPCPAKLVKAAMLRKQRRDLRPNPVTGALEHVLLVIDHEHDLRWNGRAVVRNAFLS